MIPKVRFDPAKAKLNEAKHGVSFGEAITAFGDPFARIQHDPDHSDEEDRFLLLAESERGRILKVSFAWRRDEYRVISARKATARERRYYEEEKRT